MELFHFHKQRRFKHRPQKRAEYADLIDEHLENRKYLAEDLHFLSEALYMAEKDEPLFYAIFSEEMPPHLQEALHYELVLWARLRTRLEGLAKTRLDQDEYRRRAQTLHETFQRLIKVITLEKQILYSPLTKAFIEKLDEIKKQDQ